MSLHQLFWRPPWEEPSWLEETHAWIQEQVEGLGMALAGEMDPFHMRPWSMVMGVPTDRGKLYFKAGGPNQQFEPGLLQALARWRPEDSLPVLAADADRGWALLPDGGRTLRQHLHDGDDSRPHFERLLPQYAEFQLETAKHAGELLELGCPDHRLETLGDAYERTLMEKDLLFTVEDGLTADEHGQLMGMGSLVEELCAQLAGAGIPAAIDHGDLHTNNAFVTPNGYTFFDWGDACLSHPFFSMTVTLRSIAGELNSQDPALYWARDAYLEPFSTYGSKTELVETFDAAQRLGRFQRSLTWRVVLRSIHPESTAEYRGYLAAWLRLFLRFPEED